MRNFTTIESLRGWMAWWVVLTHALQMAGSGTGTGIFAAGLRQLMSGHNGVVVFIIISGFVITHLLLAKRESYTVYLFRRFMRLVPIYLFCLIVALLVTELYRYAYIENPLPLAHGMRDARFGSEQQNFWTHLALHLSLLHGIVPDTVLPYASTALLAPAWSLSLEWQFYLIAPLMIALVMRSDTLAFGMVVASVAIRVVLQQTELRWQYDGFFFLTAGTFLIGICSRLALERCAQRRSPLGHLALAGALMLQLDPRAALIWIVFFALTAVEAGILPNRLRLIGMVHRLLALNPVMTSLGRWSYSTYLFHIPLFSVLVGAYVAAVGADNVSQGTVVGILALSLPLLVLASSLLYRFVEKPPIRYATWLIGRRRRAASPQMASTPA